MTQQDLDLEAWLDETRRALAPGDADRARVLAALEKQLSLPPETSTEHVNQRQAEHGTGQATVAQPAVTQPAATLGASAGRHALQATARVLVRWAARALLPVAGISAAALIASQLHTRDAAPSSQPAKPLAAAVSEPRTQPAAPASSTQPLAAGSDTPSQSQTENKGDKAPPAKKKPQRKKCRAANGQERPCVVESSETALAAAEPAAEPAPAAPAAEPAPPAAASLRKELEALRQAQQALRNADAARALAVLEAFEREADGPGEMREERAAAATMARCMLAQADKSKRSQGSELYSDFMQHYPRSAYAARLRRTCLLQTQP